MDDLRIIADEIQWGVPGHGTADFAVLKDGPIKKVEDLKGKVLVTNGIGGGLDMIMKAEMLKHGMVDKRDFSVIEINFPNRKSTRLNSSHPSISYAVFCLKKKKKQ